MTTTLADKKRSNRISRTLTTHIENNKEVLSLKAAMRADLILKPKRDWWTKTQQGAAEYT